MVGLCVAGDPSPPGARRGGRRRRHHRGRELPRRSRGHRRRATNPGWQTTRLRFFDETYDWLKEAKGRQKEYRKFDYRLEEIEKLKPGKGKILDLGCSFGFFLDVARGRGWNAVGVEVGEYAAKFARDKLDLDVHTGDLMDVDLPADHFEAVTLWNVLEHLDDPVAQLMRINGLMKTGGVFVLTTGDIDSYIRKVEGLRWRALIPPIHVANYSVAAVTRLLELTGFSLWVRSVALPREDLAQENWRHRPAQGPPVQRQDDDLRPQGSEYQRQLTRKIVAGCYGSGATRSTRSSSPPSADVTSATPRRISAAARPSARPVPASSTLKPTPG